MEFNFPINNTASNVNNFKTCFTGDDCKLDYSTIEDLTVVYADPAKKKTSYWWLCIKFQFVF